MIPVAVRLREPEAGLNEDEWPRIAVMGAGAVGSYFGGMLARAGAPVTLIGRPPHVEAIRRDGLFLESPLFRGQVPVSASVDPVAARDAELVLVCVKTLDTEEAARALAPHVAAGADVLSLQNGVDNVERMSAAAALEAIPVVVYVAAEMTGPGHVRHTGRGDLVIGDLPGRNEPPGGRPRRLDRLAGLFARAGVPCRVSENVLGDLWEKLTMNCAYNALSAVTRSRYGPLAGNPWARGLMRQVVEEVQAVARAAGVLLPDMDLVEAAWRLADTMPGAISSTAQDLIRGRRTEIDSLNGYVARRGAELGVAAPVNGALHALVKVLEGVAPSASASRALER